jgi:hypothetical protein
MQAFFFLFSVTKISFPFYLKMNSKPSLIVLFFLMLQFFTAYGQTTDFIPVKVDSLWGFCDKNKTIVIKPKYNEVHFFQYNYAAVKLNKKSSLINTKGEEVLPFKYDFLDLLDNGLIRVTDDCKSGFINLQGKEVIPVIYDFAIYYKKYIICQKKGSILYFNKQGEVIKQLDYDPQYMGQAIISPNISFFGRTVYTDIIPVSKNNKKGNLRYDGKEIVPTIYDEVNDPINFIKVIKDNKYGIYDLNGNIILKPEYDEIEYYGGRSYIRAKKNGKWGLSDTNGKIIVPYSYDELNEQYFSEQRIVLHLGIANDSIKIIDTLGNTIATVKKEPCKYNDFRIDRRLPLDGLLQVRMCEKSGLLTSDFKPFVPLVYDEIKEPYKGYFQVKRENKYGYVDKSGKEIIKCKYERLGDFQYSSNGLIEVYKSNKLVGYVSLEGKEFITGTY